MSISVPVSLPVQSQKPIASPQPAPDRDKQATLSACMAEVNRRATSVLLVPAGSAVMVAVFARKALEREVAIGATAVVVLVTACAAIMNAVARRSEQTQSTLARHVGPAVAVALLLGFAWGSLPLLLYPTASPAERQLLFAALAAALGSGGRLGPVLPVAMAYLAPILACSIAGLLREGTLESLALALCVAFAGARIFRWLKEDRDAFTQQILQARRARDNDDTLGSLLLHVEEGIEDWVWETDKVGRLCRVSPRFAEAAYLPLNELEGTHLVTLLGGRDHSVPSGTQAVCTALIQHLPFRNRMVELRRNGATRWWRMSAHPLHDNSGTFAGFRGIGCDMTAAHEKELRINFLANHDPLTNIANRACFQAQAAAGCEAAATDGRWRALLYLDLDGFKTVNDTFGHATGDTLLRAVAQRLAEQAPPSALVARLGGDEFGIWLDGATPTKTEALAESFIAALDTPFALGGETVTIGASVGIAFAPKHGVDPDVLLKRADLALYRAKAERRNTFRVFAEADEKALVERRRLETDISLALDRDEFEVFYQPLVGLSQGKVVGFEALIRWKSATRGSVSPADFIPVAETSGLIVEIGRYVLFQACRDAATWPQSVRVAVNVSPQQFRAADFVDTVLAALNESGLEPQRLEIEITEGVVLDKSSGSLATMRRLRSYGIRVALDDFGTGYSSLSYLVELPVDKIKIDQSFIRGLLERKQSEAVVDAILGLAKKLDLTVTAEGVETAGQAMALASRRCDQIQGYLVGKPRPAIDVASVLVSAPEALRQAMPVGQSSPLALALVMKKHTERAVREA